jgi:O-acetyl-ADP-ribose deacetylase (regulator of RNase III)
VWRGGQAGEDDLLASCYRTALDLAAAHRLASIAFPAISTGVYAFPADLAARIAIGTVTAELGASDRGISHVVFCCFCPSRGRAPPERLGRGRPDLRRSPPRPFAAEWRRPLGVTD